IEHLPALRRPSDRDPSPPRPPAVAGEFVDAAVAVWEPHDPIPLEFGLKRHGPAKDADLAKVLMADKHGLIGRVFGLKDDTLFGDVDSLEGNLVVDEHHSNFAVLDG